MEQTNNQPQTEIKPEEGTAALPNQAPASQQEPTHAALPIEVHNEVLRRISMLPWNTIDPVMDLIRKNTVYITGVIRP